MGKLAARTCCAPTYHLIQELMQPPHHLAEHRKPSSKQNLVAVHAVQDVIVRAIYKLIDYPS